MLTVYKRQYRVRVESVNSVCSVTLISKRIAKWLTKTEISNQCFNNPAKKKGVFLVRYLDFLRQRIDRITTEC